MKKVVVLWSSPIRLPKRHKAVACMMIGRPAVKSRRIAPRKGLKARTLQAYAVINSQQLLTVDKEAGSMRKADDR